MSPIVWTIAGALFIAAIYFVIRMLELDVMNRETAGQEDPLLDEGRDGR